MYLSKRQTLEGRRMSVRDEIHGPEPKKLIQLQNPSLHNIPHSIRSLSSGISLTKEGTSDSITRRLSPLHDKSSDVFPQIYSTSTIPLFKLHAERKQKKKVLIHGKLKGWSTPDMKDMSYNPSYTHFEIPYNIICLNRYRQSAQRYEAQFQNEIRELIDLQTTAYDAARLTRHLCYTDLWPPLHNDREIEYSRKNIFKLPKIYRQRIKYLMETKTI